MPRFLHELLSPHAAIRPEHLAVCWNDERIPYGELHRLTNQLAHTLRSHGCRPGDRVPVLIPNSANAVFAVLGILKAGCVAVPVDLTTPTEHLAEIVRECQPSVILVTRTARPVLDELFVAHFLGDHEFAAVSFGTLEALPIEGEHFATAFSGIDVLHESPDPLAYGATRNAPAFLFFRSGEIACDVSDAAGSPMFEATTSAFRQPTVVSHADVFAFLETSHAARELNEFDRVAVLPLLSPLAVAETFSALAAGAELHVVPPELLARPVKLAAFVRSHELTEWLTNHGSLSELIRSDAISDGDFPSLKRLLWTGDPLPAATLRDLMQRLPLAQFARVVGASARTKLGRQIEVMTSIPEVESLALAPMPLEVVPAL